MSHFSNLSFSQSFQQHEHEPSQTLSSPTIHSDFTIEELPDDSLPNGTKVIHPDELEEYQSENDMSDTDSSSTSDHSTDTAITNHMRRLRCSISPRKPRHDPEPSSPVSTTSSRKRTHSQSTVADTDTDIEYESTATPDTPGRVKRLRRQRRARESAFHNHVGGPPLAAWVPPDSDMDSVVPEDCHADPDHMDIDSFATSGDAVA